MMKWSPARQTYEQTPTNMAMMREASMMRVMITTQAPYNVQPLKDTPDEPIPSKPPYSVSMSQTVYNMAR